VAAPSTSIDQLRRIALSASERLLALPQVASVWCRAGGEDDDTFYLADPEISRETITMKVHTRYGRRPDSGSIVEVVKKTLVIDGAEFTLQFPRSGLA
jgi:Cu/Ag efflux pump CusA